MNAARTLAFREDPGMRTVPEFQMREGSPVLPSMPQRWTEGLCVRSVR